MEEVRKWENFKDFFFGVLPEQYVYAHVSGLKCTVSLHNEDGISPNGYYSQVVTQISTFEV